MNETHTNMIPFQNGINAVPSGIGFSILRDGSLVLLRPGDPCYSDVIRAYLEMPGKILTDLK